MRRRLVLAGLLGLGLAPGAGAEPVGFLAAAVGDVRVDPGGRGAWQAARRDAEVGIGDAIQTGSAAQAKIVLVDDTLLQIDEETELRIETWHVGAAATREPSILRQARGRLRTTVGGAFGASTRLEVHIPTAAIGIKGTDFEVVKAALWEVCTLSGEIVVSNRHGSASPAAGTCIYAYADKAPGDPFPNPRPPLVVSGSGGGRPGDVASDFEERIQSEVSGPGPEPGSPPGPGDGSGYEGGSGRNIEDELLPDVHLPEPEPDDDPGPIP